MALILAIESDRRQANHLTAIVRGKLHAELVMGDTAEAALERLGDRVPDLVLTSALLSPRDEQALGDRLRRLNGVAAHVQTLTLPVFAGSAPRPGGGRGGVLSALLGDRGQDSTPDGCDPAVFADQCREYLHRAAVRRESRQPLEPPPSIEIDIPAEPVSIIETVAALEQPQPRATELEEENETTHEEEGEITVDIDLSDLLEDEGEQAHAPTRAAAADDEDDEPAVYDLSVDAIEIAESAIAQPPLAAAPFDQTPSAAAPEPAPEEDFSDWQQVVDALKRESARVRLPRNPKPQPVTQSIAPAAPAPATTKPKMEPPRVHRPTKATQDEWGMFDPAQAGMAALYERLEQLSEDDDQEPARPA